MARGFTDSFDLIGNLQNLQIIDTEKICPVPVT
jgi:hypothetical protein